MAGKNTDYEEYIGTLAGMFKGVGEGITFRRCDSSGKEIVEVIVEGSGYNGMHRHDKGHPICFEKCNGIYLMMDVDSNFILEDLNEIDGKYKEFFTGTGYHGVFNQGVEPFSYFIPVPDGENTYFNKAVQKGALNFLRGSKLL